MPRETPCAICGKPAARRPENRFHPFCSERCRLIDLGKWLGGEYRIPGPSLGDGDGMAEPARRAGEEDDG